MDSGTESKITKESSTQIQQSQTEKPSEKEKIELHILIPVLGNNQIIEADFQKAKDRMEDQRDELIRLDIDEIPLEEYRQTLLESEASGNRYDLLFISEQSSDEAFLGEEYAKKGLLLDLSELLPTYYPKALMDIDLVGKVKSESGEIYAVPRVFPQYQSYGLVYKKTLTDKIVKAPSSYPETIALLEELSLVDRLKIVASLDDLFNLSIADSEYTMILPTVLLNRQTKQIFHIKDIENYNQVLSRYETCSFVEPSEYLSQKISADVILTLSDPFHIWGHPDSTLFQVEEMSYFPIENGNTPFIQYETAGAFGIGAESDKVKESLMFLSFLRDVELEDLEHYQRPDQEIIPGLLESELSVLRNQIPENLKSGDDTKLIDWLCERLNLPLPSRKVSLVMVGDMLLHDPVNESGRYEDGSYNYDHLFQHIKDEVQSADVALINQEVILGGRELGLSGYPVFNGAFEVGDAIAKAGFDIVLHATNHALDKGWRGIFNELDFWREKHPNIQVAGIHKSLEEQENNIVVTTVNDIKIAVLNFTYDTNGISPPEDMPFLVDYINFKTMEAKIKKAKEIADFVIVSPHWGVEYQTKPSAEQKNLAKFFADLEVDLILGCHPHVIEPVEWVEGVNGNKMLVYYSLGNFVNATSGTGEGVSKRMVGAMACVTIEKDPEGNIFITDYEAKPLVTHLKSGTAGISVYYLKDYSEELASENNIVSQDAEFSYDYCVNLWQEVMGTLP